MSKVHVAPNKQLRSISNIEQKMRSYVIAWNKNDLKLDVLFDSLYQQDFHGIHEGKKVNRSELKQIHTDFQSQGNQCRLVHSKSRSVCLRCETYLRQQGGRQIQHPKVDHGRGRQDLWIYRLQRYNCFNKAQRERLWIVLLLALTRIPFA